jgi:hypothetical protein
MTLKGSFLRTNKVRLLMGSRRLGYHHHREQGNRDHIAVVVGITKMKRLLQIITKSIALVMLKLEIIVGKKAH